MLVFKGLYEEPINDPMYISSHMYREIIANPVKPEPLISDSYFPSYFCQSIIDEFESKVAINRSFHGMVNKEFRDCKYVSLPLNFYTPLLDFVQTKMTEHFKCAFKNEFSAPPLIYKYDIGVGMKPHHDMVSNLEVERCKISMQPILGGDYTIVLFLNDMELKHGGLLKFHNVDIIPQTGTMVAFRVDLVHEVTPIIFGSRYSLVARVFIN